MNTLSMIKPIALLALCGFAISSTSVEARGPANPEAAKKLAEPCQACHGANGVATAPIYPHLAGQYADYLARALHEYRDGGRNNPIMAVYVEKLSDQDIAELAAYFSSMPAQVDDLYDRMNAD
ncbi:MAG: cytochrome c [Dokdonella sp.]|jgi:cytochrome c553|uniref:c-type cytochrome n=1 Tax=Dokdonella sp. TaxID=2291710 RepID=UPI0025BD5B81|nr:cytochrome c [Dokdonella sp.]HNV09014.1 cytochrome c [Dokdonella sp.]HPW03301.1 cytochrome c [Dokdonella sp.]HQV49312.1 cytochrome c [Dokdonella sp.]HQX33693.1 cytochrome c [Dokdonella sp.]